MPRINYNNKDLNMVIASNIRDRRKELCLTCQDLADMTGVCREQFRKYETGKSRISADYLYLLSSLLKVDITFFYTGYSESSPGEPTANVAPDDGVKAELVPLSIAYSKIGNSELRKNVLDFVNKLSRNQTD